MKLSQAGLLEIIAHEAVVLTRYRDIAGVWTIGIGHTRAAGRPDPARIRRQWTLAEVLALFRRDISRYEAEVRQAVRVPLDPHEFDALVSFHFNTGGIARADLTRSLNAGDRAKAAAEFMNWSKPAAIVPRRLMEQRLFAEGYYGASGEAMIYPATGDGRVDFASGRSIDLRPDVKA